MKMLCFEFPSKRPRSVLARLTRICVLALVAALAIPACAGDERAVKVKVPPVYPEIAKRMKITGSVTMEVTVDAEGKVTDVKTTNGSHVLATAAEEAVRKWKYESGAGVSTVEVTLNFSLNQW